MLRRTSDIKGYALGARDGEIGRTRDFFFDDQSWVVRYLIADTGKWLPLRKVLISPFAVRGFREHDKVVEVSLTRDQVENSPTIDHDKPVSRQFELEYHTYYNYPFYWQGAAMWGALPRPSLNYGQVTAPLRREPPVTRAQEHHEGDPHLRSTQVVSGYYIHARDGDIGHVEDFIINDEDWAIEYLVVDTRNWWPGKRVLVSPAWATSVNWDESKVHINLDRETIKGAPAYEHSRPLSREYENKLFQYYHQEPYWARKAA